MSVGRANGLAGAAKRASKGQPARAGSELLAIELRKLEREKISESSGDGIIAAFLPALVECVDRGLLVSIAKPEGSGTVRFTVLDAGERYTWWASDAEWAALLAEAIVDVLKAV